MKDNGYDENLVFEFTVKSKRLKRYKSFANACVGRYHFRVGDIVKIPDWGQQYPTYKSAFKYFTNSTNPTYFATHYDEIARKGLFKIRGMALHANQASLLVYVKDIQGQDAVIDAEGIKLIRQYPLRKGEKKLIKLDVILG